MKYVSAIACLACLLALSPDASAQLRGKDRDEVKKMVYATVYLRTDVPTNDAVEPFIEISPLGYSWDRRVSKAEAKARTKAKPSGVYWAFRPNDTVKWGSARFDNDTVTVWFEGARDELKVIFIYINTLDDFKRAFDRVFSRVPLQHEHPEWPAEVNNAIAAQRVIEGMSRQQASCVVGTPVKTETATEEGNEVVVWYPRQDTGDKRRGRNSSTGLPKTLKFVNDKLMTIES